MDIDLRLYRERPQSGLSSQWDVVVGPTTNQWESFIMSLSRNEKDYDLYYFLKHDLFELVKESLNVFELYTPNYELDAPNLRLKELNELNALRKRLGHSDSKAKINSLDSQQSSFGGDCGGGVGSSTAIGVVNGDGMFNVCNPSLSGPKSASPSFFGGHGLNGIGSSGSSTSGPPLTPTSTRTPTLASAVSGSNNTVGLQQGQQSSMAEFSDSFASVLVKSEPTFVVSG